jgi:hypothetical protein
MAPKGSKSMSEAPRFDDEIRHVRAWDQEAAAKPVRRCELGLDDEP